MTTDKCAFAGFGFTIEGKDGGFEIRPPMERDNTKVSIYRVGGKYAGEGGDFSAGALLEVIEKFYNEHF